MAHWLFKTEPSGYSYADLERDKHTVWEGVANALALQHLRAVRTGDSVVVYHTGSEKAAAGLARVSRGPYADPKLADPRRVVVDLEPVCAFGTPVPIAVFRGDHVLRGTELVRNSRLSVMPLTPEQNERIRELAAGPPAPVRRAPGTPRAAAGRGTATPKRRTAAVAAPAPARRRRAP
jgi:predicted RNA-binding protein with PUA-like domain